MYIFILCIIFLREPTCGCFYPRNRPRRTTHSGSQTGEKRPAAGKNTKKHKKQKNIKTKRSRDTEPFLSPALGFVEVFRPRFGRLLASVCHWFNIT